MLHLLYEFGIFKNGNNTEIADKSLKALKNIKNGTKNVVFQFEEQQEIGIGDVINQRGARDQWIVTDIEDIIIQGSYSHFEVTVKKEGSKTEDHPTTPQTIYNLNAPNSRVNNHSTDNSKNIVSIDARAIQHIEALRTELDQINLSNDVKADARDVLDTIEEQFKKGNPKKSVVSALLKTLPCIESITTIAGNILGSLS